MLLDQIQAVKGEQKEQHILFLRLILQLFYLIVEGLENYPLPVHNGQSGRVERLRIILHIKRRLASELQILQPSCCLLQLIRRQPIQSGQEV